MKPERMMAAVPEALTQTLLDIENLSVAFAGDGGERIVLHDVSLGLSSGEIVGVVGESGSGKTLLARAILRLLPTGARCTQGTIQFGGADLLSLSEAAMRRVRGARVGMVFQEPMMSLNPALKVGAQLEEGLHLHTTLPPADIRRRVVAMLARVGLPDPEGARDRYPHEFSGGMRQRLMIASVLSLEPQLLIADEPTTALDAVIARQVLDILVQATRELGTAVLLVSHDLAAVCRYAQRVVVMRAGRIIESGPTRQILLRPREAYTKALLEALPQRRTQVRTAGTATVAELRDVHVAYAQRSLAPWRARPSPVLRGVHLQIARGETVAVVGESGSGKTTLARALLGLVPLSSGSVRVLDAELTPARRDLPLAIRRRAQLVFQDPFASLDPRMRVGATVGEGLRAMRDLSRKERERRVADLLAEVGLGPEFARRFPHELSGGQRQRVGIARALICEPALLIADEPVSALDVTVQAQVLALLERLQMRFAFAMVFVSHDLGVVAQIADRIVIVRRGHMLEWGDADGILQRPAHPYTQELWSAAPRLTKRDGGYELANSAPSSVEMPQGWKFADGVGSAHEPIEIEPGHFVLGERV